MEIGDVAVSGTVDARTGIASIRGEARAVARQEIDTWERDTEREAR